METVSPQWNKVLTALSHLVVASSGGVGGGPVRLGISASRVRRVSDLVASFSGVLPAVSCWLPELLMLLSVVGGCRSGRSAGVVAESATPSFGDAS
jgi:hypothetical protein